MEEFGEHTIRLTKLLTKQEKKEQGIFITPKTIIAKLWDHLKPHISLESTKYILEPSAGTGEIVRYVCSVIPNSVEIVAVENNKMLFDYLVENCDVINHGKKLNIVHSDFMKYNSTTEFDIVIGNPPYVVIDKSKVPPEYAEYIIGRPNLFGLFILRCIQTMRIGGLLAFIIPKSFLNASYYSAIRNYMKTNGDLVEIVDFEKDNKFIDTQQATFGLLYRKTDAKTSIIECAYSMRFGGDNYIFNENVECLKHILEGSTTLGALGFTVKTGSIVWNQCKPQLADEGAILVYNSNISKDNCFQTVKFGNGEKKQCIKKRGCGYNENVIVINRGNGNSAYNFTFALLDTAGLGGEYYVENHLNVISWNGDAELRNGWLNKLLDSFRNPKTELFIQSFLGNGGLSKTELSSIFPIFI